MAYPLVLVFLFFILSQVSYTQNDLIPQKSQIEISGTSTLHDWSAWIERMNGNMNYQLVKGKMKLVDAELFIPVNSIRSGKKTMDNNVHNTLKSDTYPQITFKLEQAFEKENQYIITGKLMIGGFTNSIQVPVNSRIEDSCICYYGVKSLKMSEYNLEPPEYFFGTLQSGDKVKVKFDLCFIKK